jgi:hypothetical protein
MVQTLMDKKFTLDLTNKDKCIELYEAHNAEVREVVPANRLIDWQPGDGWAPICEALNLPVPDEPFPHQNTTSEFQERMGS